HPDRGPDRAADNELHRIPREGARFGGRRVGHHEAVADEQQGHDEQDRVDLCPAARCRPVMERRGRARQAHRSHAHLFAPKYCSRIRCVIPTAGFRQSSHNDFDESYVKIAIAIWAVGSVLSACGTNETNQLWNPSLLRPALSLPADAPNSGVPVLPAIGIFKFGMYAWPIVTTRRADSRS